MKRIVDGLTYNTDTSTLLAKSDGSDPDENGRPEWTESLYQTRGGAYFLVTEEERDIWSEFEGRNIRRTKWDFEAVSPESANKWILEGQREILHNPFGEVPEAVAESEPASTIFIRVPASLKRRVSDAAKAEGISENVWAMRCLERCSAAKRAA